MKATSHILFYLCCCCLLLASCERAKVVRRYDINRFKSVEQIVANKKLVLGTTVNPISFFYYKNGYAGFEYEIAKHIANKLKVKLEVKPVSNDSVLYCLLARGEIDMAANNYLSLYTDYPSDFSYTAPYYQASLIAIIAHKDTSKISTQARLNRSHIFVPTNDLQHLPVTQLAKVYANNHHIALDDSSSSFELMSSLIHHDSMAVITWDYLYQLSNLDELQQIETMPLGIKTKMSFLTSFDNHTLIDTINWMIADFLPSKKYHEISQRYFTNNQLLSVRVPVETNEATTNAKKPVKYKKGSISIYDEIFKSAAKKYRFDWKLVAAITFKESNFNPNIESAYGATGLMQLMPETGHKFGANDLFDPEQNIKAGVAYLSYLRSYWERKVSDSTQVMYFVIASYNSGQGHIIDAQTLAKKYGADSNVWFDNVEKYLGLLMEPKYYKDPDCKMGYCRASETIHFVKNVSSLQQYYITHVK